MARIETRIRSLEEIQKDLQAAELERWKALWAAPCKRWQPDPEDDGDPYNEGLRKGHPRDRLKPFLNAPRSWE